MVNDIP
ncbi:Protein of unknown function [Bacillus cytotoxicus]|nr:Protein of unknown function [Bacillus cytotoxicus]SCN34903.1 Protein of unknown function [Bacillus cytotoxicus]